MNILTTTFVLFCACNIYSQEVSVGEWQKQHSDILLVETQDATTDYLTLLDEKEIRYIIYTAPISTKELDQIFITNFSTNYSNSQGSKSAEEELEIKIWLANHPDVKVMSQDYFNSLDDSRKIAYEYHTILVTQDDTVTMSDIHAFESANYSLKTDEK